MTANQPHALDGGFAVPFHISRHWPAASDVIRQATMRLVMPNPLTHETFAEFVRVHRFVLIHFWAAWNGVDHMMHKLLETQIPANLREQVVFASLDIDPVAHHELARQHKVLNVPFLAFYRDGVLTRSVTGMQTPEVITGYLRELVYEAVA